jgi:hydrogen peroxide-dependent heme synthase
MATRTSADRVDYRGINATVRYEMFSVFQSAYNDLRRATALGRASELRATEARRHVRAEVPFFAGRRVAVDELIAALP